MKRLLFLSLIFQSLLFSRATDIESIYAMQDPNNLTKLLAFYHLHHKSPYGKKALERVFFLINKHRKEKLPFCTIPEFHRLHLDPLIKTLTKQPEESISLLSSSQIEFITKLSSHLKHRNKKGHHISSYKEIITLPSSEISISKAIFLSQYEDKELSKLQTFETTLDLYALCILAKLDKDPSDKQIVDEISNFIFHEMLFRFPPHSLWIKNVDQYTALPSILDSRHGVCLGVSILYLSLAQRLGVDLSICTPPGHIYLAFSKDDHFENIETTARGIDLPTKNYLSIQTKFVQKKNVKEVIGLYHVNAASVYWQNSQPKKAIAEYKKALLYMPDDLLTKLFLNYNYLISGDTKIGLKGLKEVRGQKIEGSISRNTLVDDLLNNHIDSSGIKAIFSHVDETRESVLKKQKDLKDILKKHPKFRDGIFHLAISWLQLGRKKEALACLNNYHKIDKENPVVEYYLSQLNFLCLNPIPGNKHFNNLLSLLKKQDHYPRCIKELKMMKKSFSLID